MFNKMLLNIARMRQKAGFGDIVPARSVFFDR